MANDVTTKLQAFESPFKKGTYSRNVWDMQVFNKKIYIGQGNSSNAGIDQNAGPIPITSFDPITSTFKTEFTVDEEQIDAFKIIEGVLYVPGHDSRESWEFGNFYRLGNIPPTWEKIRNLPRGIHVFDMAYSKGLLFAGLGNELNYSQAVYSSDMGKTWQKAYTCPVDSINTRIYSVFEYKNEVYAMGLTIPNSTNMYYGLYKFDGKQFMPFLGSKGVCPLEVVYPPRTTAKMTRVINLNGTLAYILAKSDNDQQSLPIAMVTCADIGLPKAVVFPEKTAVPMDILSRGAKTYVLTYIPVGLSFTTIVYESNDLLTWKETLRFTKDTFSRSFEELNGVMYFGLGTNNYNPTPTPAPASTGTILRVQFECPSKGFCAVQ
jgi:hypothetical protein